MGGNRLPVPVRIVVTHTTKGTSNFSTVRLTDGATFPPRIHITADSARPTRDTPPTQVSVDDNGARILLSGGAGLDSEKKWTFAQIKSITLEGRGGERAER